MAFNPLIARKRERFAELEREIADPNLFSNRKRAGETMREHAQIKKVLGRWDELANARKHLEDARELLASNDADLAEMAREEVPNLEKQVGDLEREMQLALLPADENDERDAIVE